jgi:hypothetical protein
MFDDVSPPWRPAPEVRLTEQGRAALTRAATGPDPPKPGAPVSPEFAHAEDFTWMIFGGFKYDFSKGNQSESIKALWESWERGGRRDGCGLSEKTIGEKCGSAADDFRLAHVFRNHPAWGEVIRPVQKGVFALFRPESPKNPSS